MTKPTPDEVQDGQDFAYRIFQLVEEFEMNPKQSISAIASALFYICGCSVPEEEQEDFIKLFSKSMRSSFNRANDEGWGYKKDD